MIPRRHFIGIVSSGLAAGTSAPPAAPRPLDEGFASPPDSARPWVYWLWLNGNLSKEGITADLEAMHAAGIRGVIIMSIDWRGIPPGNVRFLSPEWRALVRHAMVEGGRLGLEIDLNNDDGWNAGGPWISPDLAMQRMVWTESRASGPGKFSGTLAQPRANAGYYRDIAVIAFPSGPGDGGSAASKPAPADAPYREAEFAKPVRVRAIVLNAVEKLQRPSICELQASDDGRDFRTVRRFDTGWNVGAASFTSLTFALPETLARLFRVRGFDLAGKPAGNFEFTVLEAARVNVWEMKAGFTYIREHGAGAHMFLPGPEHGRELPAEAVIRREDMLDLTGRMDASGRLDWEIPPGNWTILRLGHTPTGATNGPATPEGKGLDCDKFSRAAIEAHFQGMMAKVLADLKNVPGHGLRFFHNDSWECGSQTWTAAFRDEFRRRRGYDLLPYLPVMAGGRVVESYEISERFLWDLRRTFSDLIRDNHWLRLGELCHEHGLQYSVEPAGRQQFLYDPIDILSKGDLLLGEFWVTEERARPDCKLASSAAHLYGRTLAAAEAFTCNGGPGGEWKAHPFWLKAKGDEAFANGVNRLVFHRYIHQPYLDRRPGLHWGTVGTQFERTQTWWGAMPSWTGYLSRCQYLLQQGVFVADACYLASEGAPNTLVRVRRRPPRSPEGQDASTNTLRTLTRHGALPPLLPSGYDFDGCNPDSVMRMTVRGGRLVLPSGMSYAVLVLPLGSSITPRLLRKIRDLVEAGAVVVGRKPTSAPGLSDYPRCDVEVQRLAEEVWGHCDGKAILEHSFGKGKVVWGKPLDAVFAELRVPPDFDCVETADLDYIHRRDGGAEIYFVSNQREEAAKLECTFRVSGKQPELWDPATGRVVMPAVYWERDGRTVLPLRFDPAGSVFVIFRENRKVEPAVRVEPDADLRTGTSGGLELLAPRSGTYVIRNASGRPLSREVRGLPEPLTIGGPWEVRFPAGWGAPARITLDSLISFTEHADDGVRHFSGSAVYAKQIGIPAEMARPGRIVYLDLGRVEVVAAVRVNGNDLGYLWKPPFLADISEAVRAGANRLEITVANLWPNRLIGDLKLPESNRRTWTNSNMYTAESPLLESGLLGPVVVRAVERVPLKV